MVLFLLLLIFVLPVISLYTSVSNVFNSETATIDDITNVISRNQLTCERVLGWFMRRIDANDKRGPTINALITVNSKAMDEARQLDREFNQTSKLKGKLHCVPVLVKDTIDVAQLPTTGGVNILKNLIPQIDSTVVSRLKRAGAIVVGKANMAWLSSFSDNSTSETGGLSRNAFGPTYSTHGSSGGCGGGGAAMFAVICIGAETGMSLNLPASSSNLVTVRVPKVPKDLYPVEGALPAVEFFDVLGPMTKKVRDLAITLDVLTERYGEPYYSSPLILDNKGLSGLKIGVFRELTFDRLQLPNIPVYNPTDDVKTMVNDAVRNMLKAGATVKNITVNLTKFATEFFTVFNYNSSVCRSQTYEAYLGNRARFPNPPFRTLEQIIATKQLPPFFQADFIKDANRKDKCSQARREFPVMQETYRKNTVNSLFSDLSGNKFDIVMMASTDRLPPQLKGAVDIFSGAIIASNAGWPSLNLPLGFSPPKPGAPQGLPFGAILMSRPEGFETLIRAAFAYQNQFGDTRFPSSFISSPPESKKQ